MTAPGACMVTDPTGSVRIVKLSAAMCKALDMAEAHGGVLKRYPGGFWAQAGWAHTRGVFDWVGSQTVQALVDRGVMRWASGTPGLPWSAEVVKP